MSATSNNLNHNGCPVLGFEDDIIPGDRKKAGGNNSSGASATEAALALSRLPVLGHFRKNVSFFLAVVVILANVSALVGLVVYFRRTCTDEYGVLPNESGDFTPPALASLESQGGVTINSRTLVNFQTDDSYTQLGQSYWTPLSLTCGCADCNLASCAATIPIVVEYERCNPWLEVRRCQKYNLFPARSLRLHCCCNCFKYSIQKCTVPGTN